MGIFRPRAKPDLSLLKGTRAYKPYHPTPEKKVTTEDIIPLNPRLVRPLIADESPDRDRTAWGISTREAAGALTSVFGRGIAPATSEPIGDSSDGIAPCGYDVL